MTSAQPTDREAALTVFRTVMRKSRPLDEALERIDALPARDRAFARMLAATALRRLGQIDAVLDLCVDRPLPDKANMTVDILRLGAAQILFMDVPDHAAVDTAVSLVKAKRQGQYAKLANAVLRRVARDGRTWVADQDGPRLNTPDWLWEAWIAAFGEASARAVAEAHLSEPALDITVKDPAEADTWAERLEAVVLPTGSLRRTAGAHVPELPGYADGAWWVQDAAAALPARLLGDIKDRFVADLCAAPGGKTAQLAAMGAEVCAVDRSAKRLKRLRGNLARLGLPAEAIAADAARLKVDRTFDSVLLDAPCSATGTIRRHPDVARLKRPEDVEKLAAVQRQMLAHAATLVKPGGLVVYCVCSLQPEEGKAVVEQVMDAAGLARVPVTAEEVGGLGELLTPEGDVRTLPAHLAHQGGLDGFFIARLRKADTG